MQFFSFLKKVFLPILLVYFISNNLEQLLTTKLEFYMRTEGESAFIWLYASVLFLTGLILPVFAICFASFGAQKLSFSEFCGKNIKYLFIENLRSLGRIITYGFFFIIPGFIQHIRLVFVPIIVALNPEYQLGRYDALKLSQNLIKKNIFKLLGVLLVFEVIIPMILSSEFDQFRDIEHFPLQAMGLIVSDTFIFIVFAYLIIKLYNRSWAEWSSQNESTI